MGSRPCSWFCRPPPHLSCLTSGFWTRFSIIVEINQVAPSLWWTLGRPRSPDQQAPRDTGLTTGYTPWAVILGHCPSLCLPPEFQALFPAASSFSDLGLRFKSQSLSVSPLGSRLCLVSPGSNVVLFSQVDSRYSLSAPGPLSYTTLILTLLDPQSYTRTF